MSKLNILIASLLFAGCSNELPFPERPAQEEGPIVRFVCSVDAELDSLITPETRAVITGTHITDGQHVGIYAMKGFWGSNGQTNLNITPASPWDISNIQRLGFQNGEYEPRVESSLQEQIYILRSVGEIVGRFPAGTADAEGALRFYAYYPYSSDVIYTGEGIDGGPAAAPSIPVVINENLNVTNDYLYTGRIDARSSDTPVNLPFRHALGRMDIYATTSNPDFSGRNVPEIKKIIVSTMKPQQGYMNIETGRITPAQGVKDKYDFTYIPDTNDRFLDYDNKDNPHVQPVGRFMLMPSYANAEVDLVDPFYYIAMVVDFDGEEKTYIVHDRTRKDLTGHNNADHNNLVLEPGKILKLTVVIK